MDNLALSQGGNLCFTSGATDPGTAAGTAQINAAITFTINGRFYSKGLTDNISIAHSAPAVYGQPIDGSFTGQAGGSTRLYGLFLNSAGVVSVVGGPIVKTSDLAAKLVALPFPAAQKDKACFAVLRVALTAGTTFVPGTTSLVAAGVTASFIDLSAVPAEPLRS